MRRKRERERQRFAELDKDVTGRGAQTVRCCDMMLRLHTCCQGWLGLVLVWLWLCWVASPHLLVCECVCALA
jgi:hypothetical protein